MLRMYLSRRKFLNYAGAYVLGTAGVLLQVGCADASKASSVGSTAKSAPDATRSSSPAPVGSTSLVVFFSRAGENYEVGVVEKGNTEIIANEIVAQTGFDSFQIETVQPYPEAYSDCTDFAKQEQADNARPELKADVNNWDTYDTVYLGYPIWWGDMPMAVYTFIESHDWSGKTVRPFSTNAGSGLADTVSTLASKLQGAAIEDALTMLGATAQHDADLVKTLVSQWLQAAPVA